MSQVVVVATFQIKPDKVEEAHEALREVIESSHAEAGCQSYALHVAADDPTTMVMVERWTSQVALDSHFQQPYVAALGQKARDLVAAPPQILFLEPVPVGDPVKGSL